MDRIFSEYPQISPSSLIAVPNLGITQICICIEHSKRAHLGISDIC